MSASGNMSASGDKSDDASEAKSDGVMSTEGDVSQAEDMWQLKTTNLSEQNLFLLEHSVWVDCVFIVGTPPGEVKKFGCHRLLLGKVSPVFGSMLFGARAEKKDIIVTDINPDTFELLVMFAYGGCVDFCALDSKSLQNLCLAADKYMIQSLTECCCEQLEAQLSPASVCHALHVATLLNNHVLSQKAHKMLLERTDEVLSAATFNTASQDFVLKLVQEPSLHLDSEFEFPLIAACMAWAEHEVKRRKLQENQQGYTEALGLILQHLRVYSLTAKECGLVSHEMKFCSDEEKYSMIINICKQDFSRIPEYLCPTSSKRQKTLMLTQDLILNCISYSLGCCFSCNKTSSHDTSLCLTKDCLGGVFGLRRYKHFTAIWIEGNCDMKLHGLRLAYNCADLQMCVLDAKNLPVALGNSIVYNRNDKFYDVKFESPCIMKKSETYIVLLSSDGTVDTEGMVVNNMTGSDNLFEDFTYAPIPGGKALITHVIYTKAN